MRKSRVYKPTELLERVNIISVDEKWTKRKVLILREDDEILDALLDALEERAFEPENEIGE